MATYYVRNDGSDANSGLGPATNQAWQTLEKALGVTGIGSGDTLWIAPGDYRRATTITVGGTYTTETFIKGDPTASQFPGMANARVLISNRIGSDGSTGVGSQSQIIDLKGLMGDASDNLPGIPGVGEKTAIKLLKEYGTLENVIEHKEDIKGKLGERIAEHFESAILCKKIATIKKDVELTFPIEDTVYQGVDEEKMMTFFNELELHSLIKKYNKTLPKVVSEFKYKVIKNTFELDDIISKECYLVLESFNTNYHYEKDIM